jgi:hypothetical protein
LIHGYRYNFIRVPPYAERSVYWSKVPAISDLLLDGCKVVVLIDHDAIFQNMELPFEWLLNRWGFTKNTSFAMSLDNHWAQNEDDYGVLNINAGFIVSQGLDRTHEILRAWDSCPSNETTYPNCRKFIKNWPAEQGAFGNFMRRQFDLPTDLLPIACTEANGFPGMGTECTGDFIRHYTIAKDRVNGGTAASLAQLVFGLVREEMVEREQSIKIKRPSNAFTKSWQYEGSGVNGDPPKPKVEEKPPEKIEEKPEEKPQDTPKEEPKETKPS